MARGYGYFAKNIGLLTVSNFGSKFLGFLLVPLYTNVLTTEQYGTYDILYTSVSLLIPLLTINLNEGVMRFCLDKNQSKDEVLSVAAKVLVLGCFLLGLLLVLNHAFGVIPLLDEFAVPFALLYVVNAANGILVMYARGVDRIADVAVSGILCSAFMLGFSVLLLVVFPLGLTGYFASNIVGPAVQAFYIVVKGRLWRELSLGRPTNGEGNLFKRMTSYTTPMIANSVSWWVSNAAGKYAVIFICGAAMNGIYSASYKIPSILSMFQSIVYSAWVLSAVQDFDPDDKSGFFSNTYNAYGFAMSVLCSIMIIVDRPLAGFLYGSDFCDAWIYVPPLLISIVFLSLASFLGGVFSAVKDSRAYAKSSMVAALCNVILSFLLVWQCGIMGAAIAVVTSYLVMLVLRLRDARKYIKLRVRLARDFCSYAVLTIQAALLVLLPLDSALLYLPQVVCLAALLALYRRELLWFARAFSRKFFGCCA